MATTARSDPAPIMVTRLVRIHCFAPLAVMDLASLPARGPCRCSCGTPPTPRLELSRSKAATRSRSPTSLHRSTRLAVLTRPLAPRPRSRLEPLILEAWRRPSCGISISTVCSARPDLRRRMATRSAPRSPTRLPSPRPLAPTLCESRPSMVRCTATSSRPRSMFLACCRPTDARAPRSRPASVPSEWRLAVHRKSARRDARALRNSWLSRVECRELRQEDGSERIRSCSTPGPWMASTFVARTCVAASLAQFVA